MHMTFDGIRRLCAANHLMEGKRVREFFDAMSCSELKALYNPTIGAAVLYCDWGHGDESFELVYATPDEIAAHCGWLTEAYGHGEPWTCDILADFDHYSWYMDAEHDVEACIAVLSTVAPIDGWVSAPNTMR